MIPSPQHPTRPHSIEFPKARQEENYRKLKYQHIAGVTFSFPRPALRNCGQDPKIEAAPEAENHPATSAGDWRCDSLLPAAESSHPGNAGRKSRTQSQILGRSRARRENHFHRGPPADFPVAENAYSQVLAESLTRMPASRWSSKEEAFSRGLQRPTGSKVLINSIAARVRRHQN